MATEAEEVRGVGHSVRRKEDDRFIRGKGNYVDDVKLPGMLHMAILRSPYAHAKINGIDTAAAVRSRCDRGREAAPGGISRASLARRFTALVGEAPMSYLTGWRITLAADQLRATRDTVETIARRVGYANAFALSVAFKRVRGTTPTAHRQAA